MGCSSCSNGGGVPAGCGSNGSCKTNGCNKLTVFDWLDNMELPSNQKPFDWVEVRFKNGRKEFFKNTNELALNTGDVVAVESSPGHDIGTIALQGELVRLQMKKKGFKEKPDQIKKVYRHATQKDLDKWKEVREREENTMFKSREIAKRLELQMKISDVEFQGDGAKAIFYYTADERIDFRQLIKDLAQEFTVRIEMRQIGARQEAARLGGIGSCGRELCCSTWLTDFRTVNTSAARYQQLSLNPTKLAGQCGKLKCCLNYELDTYLEALKKFPDQNVVLKTKKGRVFYQKMDIFKGIMWYAYEGEPLNWIPLPVDVVNEIAEKNKAGQVPESVEMLYQPEPITFEPTFEDGAGKESLTRFDRPKKGGKRRNKPKHRSQKSTESKGQSGNKPTEKQKAASGESPKMQGNKKRNPRGKGNPNRNRPNKKRRNNNPNHGKKDQ